MKVLVQTTVQAVFGELDNDNNIINKQPVSFEVAPLNKETWDKALEALLKVKEGNA